MRGSGKTRSPTVAACALALAASLGTGCAHNMIIETEPPGAVVTVDGERIGVTPIVTEQRTGFGDRLRVKVEADNFQEETVVVTQTDWFLWPGLISLVPLFGVPFVVIPFVGPFITVGWLVVTSPTLIALVFTRKYPDRVVIKLKPKIDNGLPMPTDSWLIPDSYDPNPPPLAKPPDEEKPLEPPPY